MTAPAGAGVRIGAEAPALAAYAAVPIAFTVHERLELAPDAGALAGLPLVVRPLATPYVKDHDADAASHPVSWAHRFDISRWAFLVARLDGRRIGGAAVIPPGASDALVDGAGATALLWDLRVAPDVRGGGVGTALFEAACAWARTEGAQRLEVETQNVNVPACRFYAARGCTLGAVHRFVYPALPEEMQLLWYRDVNDGPRRRARGAPRHV